VITTTCARNIADAQDLGADQVIGYRAGHFEDGAEPVDAAIALIGQRDGDPFVIGLERAGRWIFDVTSVVRIVEMITVTPANWSPTSAPSFRWMRQGSIRGSWKAPVSFHQARPSCWWGS
jgi:NADPH:quinone reductase-like Zn-dependent oxidoreductase